MVNSKSAKLALMFGMLASNMSNSPDMFNTQRGGSTQCTGNGNNTTPIGHVKKKKKEFGSPNLTRKQRKKLKKK